MSKRTRNLYAWKTRTEDGRKRQVEAQLFGAQWKVTSHCAGDEEWVDHDPPLLEDLEDLELKVFNKYTKRMRQALGRMSSSEYPPENESRTPSRMGDRPAQIKVVKEVIRGDE